MGGKYLVYFVLVLLLVPFSFGATIHGAVYDADYNLITDVQLNINSTPKQSHISKNGAYFFFVPLGTYEITAEKFFQKELIFSANNTIDLTKDGEFQSDIIIGDIFVDDIPREEDLGPSLLTLLRARFGMVFYGAAVLILILILMAGFFVIRYFIKNKPKLVISLGEDSTEMPKDVHNIGTFFSVDKVEKKPFIEKYYDTETVLKAIREEGGRTTQKDIRKRIPLSEAKVSLLISELEMKGKIKKIKKGRGNIIILNEMEEN